MSSINIKEFDEKTQREIASFMEQEQQKFKLQSSVHHFTNLCWDKCITGTPGGRFARGEESCLVNCVDRFLDTSLFMVKRLEETRAQQQSQL